MNWNGEGGGEGLRAVETILRAARGPGATAPPGLREAVLADADRAARRLALTPRRMGLAPWAYVGAVAAGAAAGVVLAVDPPRPAPGGDAPGLGMIERAYADDYLNIWRSVGDGG